jgi:hypothetical protein
MGVVTILCPRTGERVSTGLETDAATFEAIEEIRSTVKCWACGGEHAWSKRWASLVAEDRPPAGRHMYAD